MPRPPPDGFKPKNTAVEKAFTSISHTKLSYTHGVLASDEELTELEDLML